LLFLLGAPVLACAPPSVTQAPLGPPLPASASAKPDVAAARESRESVQATGSLEARDVVSVESSVSGRVFQVLVDVGTQVRAGDVLTEIGASASVPAARTQIRSPSDGVVVMRAVDPGMVVAAGVRGPELFKVARDLRALRVVLHLEEAAFAKVRERDAAILRVDAFPAARFSGTVSRVDPRGEPTGSVVTYAVVVDVDDPTGRLRPGMTAAVALTPSSADGGGP
jgi:HlyD family secretion protein